MRKVLVSVLATVAVVVSCTTAERKQTLNRCVEYQGKAADPSCSDQDKKDALSWYQAKRHADNSIKR